MSNIKDLVGSFAGSDYRQRFTAILGGLNQNDKDCEAQGLVGYADSLGFFDSPASTRFHGASGGGLARHSWGVLEKACELKDIFGLTDSACKDRGGLFWFHFAVACLFHDVCKAGLYTTDWRNVKDDRTGQWSKQPFFKVKDGSTACGHGGESLRAISRFVSMPFECELAVYWHMGSYGLSSDENIQYMNACKKFPLVLLLHTADMLQVSSGGD